MARGLFAPDRSFSPHGQAEGLAPFTAGAVVNILTASRDSCARFVARIGGGPGSGRREGNRIGAGAGILHRGNPARTAPGFGVRLPTALDTAVAGGETDAEAGADMRARVTVMLKAGVLDPQGEAVRHALTALGFEGVTGVRQGKVIEIDLEGTDRAAAEAQVTAMCERLLANTVIERYAVEILPG